MNPPSPVPVPPPPPPAGPESRLLLLDIGNTHCHAGIASPAALLRQTDLPTPDLLAGRATGVLRRLLRGDQPRAAVVCSVVPAATRATREMLRHDLGLPILQLTHRTLRGLGLDYPRPQTIGPDRLANALAARHFVGAPCVVVDFGTAVTFDIVDRTGRYVGGIIAPGLAAMTDYLHEKTALLPRIRIREVKSVIGRSTEEAMLSGAVHGYRGLVRELLQRLQSELGRPRPTVVATGGYAALLARGLPEIAELRPHLTLDGLRLLWRLHQPEAARDGARAGRTAVRARRSARRIRAGGRGSPVSQGRSPRRSGG